MVSCLSRTFVLVDTHMNNKKFCKKAFMMVLGAFLYAAALSLFMDPNNLAPGGVSGIAIILNRIFPVSVGALIIIINIPLVILGLVKLGWKLMLSTIISTGLISVFTDFIKYLVPVAPTHDPLLAAVIGAAVGALGIGITFRAGSTGGGVDIIVKILRRKYPHVKTGTIFLIMDMCIVIASGIVFKNAEHAMYAGLTVFIQDYLIDIVLYGRDGAKLIYIISDCSPAIAKRLLDELNLGVTYLSGEGGYSGTPKQVIMCVAKKAIAPRTEEIVKQEDPKSFMIVTSASEIYGEGYKSYYSEKL